MSDPTLDAARLAAAIADRRWTILARTGVDLQSVATWDRGLDRRTRILVPVDVQAFVVPKGGGEPTVAVTGTPPGEGFAGDPPPFAPGAVRAAGVHLHWAMPDALLRGRERKPAPGSDASPELELPALPDRWVVIRASLPDGAARATLRGWVIDARTQSVTPMATFAGTPDAPPAGAVTLDPLDGQSGGSLLWSASYAASAGRFGFHDPLDDLAAAPSHANAAVYVVGGWWSDVARDPLAGALGTKGLDARLDELGWHVEHDVEDTAQQPAEDWRVARLRQGVGLTSPAVEPTVSVTTAEGRPVAHSLGAVAFQGAVPVSKAEKILVGPSLPRYAALLHGAVLGVPVGGALPAGADDRPASASMAVAVGLDVDDVIAAFGPEALGIGAAHRADAERLAAAFTSDLIERLGDPDGLADLAEREHGDGFGSYPGTPLPGARPDRLRAEDSAAVGPTTVGRKGRGALADEVQARLSTELRWKTTLDLVERKGARSRAEQDRARALGDAKDAIARGRAGRPQAREVVRPAPRFFHPLPPMLAVRGARPNHRHHGDGLYEGGVLRCRYPRQVVPGWPGVVRGQDVVPTLGSGAVPPEMLGVVREAVVLNPYAYRWLAAAGEATTGGKRGTYETRLAGEMVRLFGTEGRYDGSSHLKTVTAREARAAAADPWSAVRPREDVIDRAVVAELSKHALLPGMPPSPVAITAWRQPWVPLWLEWRVTLEGSDALDGWTLDGLDFERAPGAPAPTITRTVQGRSPTGQGLSRALHASITEWLTHEIQRDAQRAGVLGDADQAVLDDLARLLAPLDLVSASLDGVREALLGIADDGAERPRATGAAVPLFGGTLRLDALRLVDAFGRTADVPTATARTTTTLEVPARPAAITLRPRFQHHARWLWRLVDPAHPQDADPALAPDAFVDQLEPRLAVNPVAGFLLPDHVDEALECFDVDGTPLGQLAHDAVSGAVTWEPAPGRPLPPDAGPLAGLGAHAAIVGQLAAGVVLADESARGAAGGVGAEADSALAAMLRAIDTTLWSVDTFTALGSPSVAGLVGRPIAVVRATLTLEVPDDLADVDVAAPATADARRAEFAAVRERRFPVQLGTLTRSDDALLGFFVDDDYARLHLVDKVVAATAREGGRHRGQLGMLGQTAVPDVAPLDHPYVLGDDVLLVRPGQTVRLTLLMLPAGKAHLTSGVLPRKALALQHDWVARGLAALVPSVRVGPVLVDPAEIRLPLVASLGEKQTFTRRTGPLTWRDDPIVAATQAALLPRLPHEAQEGWIRVLPQTPTPGGAA
ncbi:hypothetical protein [Roseisolibacter sp. H3M3-2]|uniref:hypothetical protein n=1 Tax=Roseisolibacter sp. H3M3-2 TaxID=3031323 RepID=UPI0023DC40AD|nr:hypothetical protein [Roseisolibacter sp. H3M3-2]MDF1505375.1 hypothetical protein [Roseisolibacter sp. H3M3-2]